MISESNSLRTFNLLYFVYFASLGAFYPFISIFFKARGFSASQCGLLLAVLPISKIIIPPLLGFLADQSNTRKTLLATFLLLSVLTMLMLLPSLDFRWTFIIMTLFAFSRAPVIAFMDSFTHEYLGEQNEIFGKIRRWGSVGFLFASSLFGWAFAEWTEDSLIVGASVLLFACYWLTRFKLPDAPSQTHAQENSTHKQALKRFLISPITPPLLIGLAIYYMAHSMFDAYFSWHLIDLGYSETWIGVGWSIGVFAEVLIMGIFHKLLRKVAPMHLLIFAAIVSALRWYALANTHDLVWILLSQPLHAITFGIFYLSCTHWLQLKGVLIRSTTQSIGLSCIALGTLAGYQVGGHLLQHHSSTSMFQLMTTLALGAGLLFSVALALERHQEKFAKTQ